MRVGASSQEENFLTVTVFKNVVIKSKLSREAPGMQEAAIKTSPAETKTITTVSSLLRNCNSLIRLKQIHALIHRTHLHQNNFLAATLVSLCGSFFAIPYAQLVFASIIEPNVFLFNHTVKLYSKNSLWTQAIRLYRRMYQKSINPDNFTFPFLLNSCAGLTELNQGREIHGRILKTGFDFNIPVQNALIDMYGKCGSLDLARKVFDEMPERDVVSCNAVLGAYARVGEDMGNALQVFDEMVVKNVISWNAMIFGYVNYGDLNSARKMFDEMPKRNVVSWTTLIIGYTRYGFVNSACFLFEDMPEKNLLSWTAMIGGYVQNGKPDKALKFFHRMQEAGVKPDAVTMTSVISACAQLGCLELANWVGAYIHDNNIELNEHVLTALVDMHAKCGNLEKACQLFEEIHQRSVFSYTALITGLASHGYANEALEIFRRMQIENIEPNEITFVGVLNACRHSGFLEEGLRLWEGMIKEYGIAPCVDHYSCMVDLLGRSGRLEEAQDLVRSMPRPHPSALGALLAACRTHSNIDIAESVAKQLFELEPKNTGNFVLLANIYASINQWDGVAWVREAMRKRGIKKVPGCSWIEVDNRAHGFRMR